MIYLVFQKKTLGYADGMNFGQGLLGGGFLMLVLEFKLKVSSVQLELIKDAIRSAQFIRNSCLRYWMDGKKEDKINRFALNKYTKVLADNPDFPWAKKLNSMARQAAAERTWFAISRFFDNCKKGVKGKKGYPRFKKNSRSVEYKTTGWSLSKNRKYLTMTDKFNIGRMKRKYGIYR